MKKIFLCSLLILSMSAPATSEAVTKEVIIDWSMPSITDVQGYKLYYSYSSDMVNKIWHQDCDSAIQTPSSTYSMACHNVILDTFPVYFSISAITPAGEIASSPQKADAPISAVMNFGLLMPNSTPLFAQFDFTSAGGINNEQIYNNISNSWIGTGATTGTFTTVDGRNVLQCNSSSCRVGIPANEVMGAVDKLTIEVTYKTALLSYNYFPFYYAGSGDSFTYNLSSTSHNCSVRTNYSNTYATASFPATSSGTWHTMRTLIDFANKTMRVFMDNVELSVSPNTTNLANWGALSGNLYFAFINDSTTQNLIIDEVKIWHDLVTP